MANRDIHEHEIKKLRRRIAELEQTLENQRQTLIGISKMDAAAGERMKLWATDHLSGTIEAAEKTIFGLSDRITELEATCDGLRAVIATKGGSDG